MLDLAASNFADRQPTPRTQKRDDRPAGLDPKADRKRKTLIIKSLIFESHFKNFDRFIPVFAKKMTEFARFNECEKIEINKVNPGKLKSSLEGYILNKS